MNKGFTLMELLAVIVLLALLSGVVLFSLGSIINSSKTNLTNNQITLIEKAAQVYYLEEGINSEKYSFNNTKSCISLEYLIKNGYVDDDKVINIAKNKEFNGSVEVTYKANQYQYKYKDTKCPVSACKIIKGDGINIGDEIECAGEYFYVIESNEDTISMLAKYNLDVGNYYDTNTSTSISIENPTGIQNEKAKGEQLNKEGTSIDLKNLYGQIKYSTEHYWHNSSTGKLKEQYGTEYTTYIFDENSSLYEYVEFYENYLKKKGISSAKATLMSYEQAISLGCDVETNACINEFKGTKLGGTAQKWVYSTSYWLGSASDSSSVWTVGSMGIFSDTWTNAAYDMDGDGYDDGSPYGIRPVVNISVDEL